MKTKVYKIVSKENGGEDLRVKTQGVNYYGYSEPHLMVDLYFKSQEHGELLKADFSKRELESLSKLFLELSETL